LARSYVDQLTRSGGLSPARLASVNAELTAAEKASGQKRKDLLNTLSMALHTEARSSSDAPKAHMLASAVGDLAK
jgi:hypothetical protein